MPKASIGSRWVRRNRDRIVEVWEQPWERRLQDEAGITKCQRHDAPGVAKTPPHGSYARKMQT